MGLDATVFCDCFEKGRLRSAPLAGWSVHVTDDGSRSAQTGTLEDDLAFDQWNVDACEHEWGVLLHHRIGNVARVGLLRDTLSRHPHLFPIILARIVYNGIHCGDCIATDQIPALAPELRSLAALHSDDAVTEECVRDFERRFRELVDVAMAVRKPISF